MDENRKDELVQQCMPLVNQIVSTMCRRFSGYVQHDEIHSLALVGLADAISKYDAQRSKSFKNYARIRIQGAVYDGVIAASWFPRSLIRQIAFYRKADEMMRESKPESPPADTVETAHRLAGRLKELAGAYVTTCACPGEYLPSPDSSIDAEAQSSRNQFIRRVSVHVKRLPKKQQDLIRKYYYEDVSLKDIALEYGHTKSWSSRLLAAALDSLRENFEEAPDPTCDPVGDY